MMAVEQHLALQELILSPSEEWTPSVHDWLVARVSDGVGYALQTDATRELNVGDGFLVGRNTRILLRSSQLGPLKVQFFNVQLEYLNGLLSVTDSFNLKAAHASPLTTIAFFSAGELVAQKFSRIADLPDDNELSLRCSLLLIWSGVLNGLLAAPVTDPGNRLHQRLREVVGNMTEAELADASLAELAAQLNCSERHFRRLFRVEFGVPLRTHRIELRLQRAHQLLADSNAKITSVAYDCGYRHLNLFNAMFKKRFGLTPIEWRRQNKRATSVGVTRWSKPSLRSRASTFHYRSTFRSWS